MKHRRVTVHLDNLLGRELFKAKHSVYHVFSFAELQDGAVLYVPNCKVEVHTQMFDELEVSLHLCILTKSFPKYFSNDVSVALLGFGVVGAD